MATYTLQTRNGPIELTTELSVDSAIKILQGDQKNKSSNNFRDSLLNSHTTRGLSTKQELWVLKLAQDSIEDDAKASIDGPFKSLFKPFTVAGLKKLKIRFGDLDLSRAPDHGINKGHLYVCYHGNYSGKVTPSGHYKGSPRQEIVDRLEEVAADPIQAAIDHGRETGSCACCGRSLSDPLSVFIGVGPICFARIAGDDARKEADVAFKSNDEEGFKDVLRRLRFYDEKETGRLAASPVEVKEEEFSDPNDYLLAKALGGMGL